MTPGGQGAASRREQQQQQQQPSRGGAPRGRGEDQRWREVWSANLEEEMSNIQDVAEACKCVAVDAVVPGTLVQPLGIFSSYRDYNYRMLKHNVDLTSVIQISLVLTDDDGKRPLEGISGWKFNFLFDAGEDLFAPDSLDGLCRARAVDLRRHREQGIKVIEFAELLMSSGLVLNEDMKWITYYGPKGKGLSEGSKKKGGPNSGNQELPWVKFSGSYHLAYLLRLLQQQPLPDEPEQFEEDLDLYFPSRFDIAKHLHQLPKHARPGADSQQGQHQQNGGRFGRAEQILEVFAALPSLAREGRTDQFFFQDDRRNVDACKAADCGLPGNTSRSVQRLGRPAATAA